MCLVKRMVIGVEKLRERAANGENGSFDINPYIMSFDQVLSDDLNTPEGLARLDVLTATSVIPPVDVLRAIEILDQVLGFDLHTLKRADLRIRPKSATITESEIEAILARRKGARVAKDFATSDALRDELTAHGVEVMDGDPLGWDWKLV